MIDTAMRQPANILIVGAGPAGLALALTLRRQGHAPQLIERAHRFPAGGAGIYLVGNGTRALRSLGLADAAVDAGYTIPAQHFCDHHGTLLAGVDVAAYWNGCGPCLGLRRSELLRVLADPLADAPIRWNTTLRSLQLADGRVALRFSDGTAGEFDLVVGADGIHSSIRDFLYGAAPPAYRGQIAWRFLAPRPAAIDGWTVFLGSGTTFLLVPVDATQVYCYADLRSDAPGADGGNATPDRLRALFRDYAAPVQEVLAGLPAGEQIAGLPVQALPPRWGRGNVVLIGDAAHAMSPNMANGAALAFEDALALAELLGENTPAVEMAEHLGRRRERRVAWVGRQTERRDRTRALPPSLRNLSLRLLGRRMYHGQYRPLLEPA